MIIYPAIDLRDGKCIRLYQGDYNHETIYSLDPFRMAKTFVDDGANWLHIIDLDGAKDPKKNQSALIASLIKKNNINVQTGGGIRTKAQIKSLLEQGAKRAIVGSMAVFDQKEVSAWFNYFGAERIVLAMDVRASTNNVPKVCVNAWQNISEYSLFDLIDYYQHLGLKHLLCTNVALDGTLNGPDYALYDLLLAKYPFLDLQASGGTEDLSAIKTLRQKKLSGVVIGRALYEKKMTLREALSC
jgi:phosphoribosylformimino-5-aminoimidazole carboxamide ribotide isomerase